MASTIRILSCDSRDGGVYVRWIDANGLQHDTEHELLMRYCSEGRHGLTAEDAARFKEAHTKHLAELELDRPLEGRLRQLAAAEDLPAAELSDEQITEALAAFKNDIMQEVMQMVDAFLAPLRAQVWGATSDLEALKEGIREVSCSIKRLERRRAREK